MDILRRTILNADWWAKATVRAIKTAAQVAGIAVDAGTKPTDADLVSSVTIAIGGFQSLIAKALA